MKYYNLCNDQYCPHEPIVKFQYTDVDGNPVTGMYQLGNRGLCDILEYFGDNITDTSYNKTINPQGINGPVDISKPITITIVPAKDK